MSVTSLLAGLRPPALEGPEQASLVARPFPACPLGGEAELALLGAAVMPSEQEEESWGERAWK